MSIEGCDGFRFYRNGLYYRKLPSGGIQCWNMIRSSWVLSWCHPAEVAEFPEISWDQLPDDGARATAFELEVTA